MGRLACLPLALLAACFHRDRCARDAECPGAQVCYPDHQCLPRDVAARAGAPPGRQCTSDDQGCRTPGYCWNGYCVGEPRPDLPPSFDGLGAVDPDGSGALLLYWSPPSDDATPQGLVDVLIWRSTSPGVPTDGPPIATTQDFQFRDTGLTTGVTYYYRARARDNAGQLDHNQVERSATAADPPVVAPGVDYATQIQPLFTMHCTSCHGGSASLYLGHFAEVLMGGQHGPIVVPCDPDASHLIGKLGPTPPFGARMPRSGPPYLTPADLALLRRWIADGAQLAYDPATCDHTAPSFAGIASLTTSSSSACVAGWSAASDDVTPAAALRYRAYLGAAPGGERFAAPVAESAPGALSLEIAGIPTGQPSWVVVRAVDAQGNQDANTTELTCTP